MTHTDSSALQPTSPATLAAALAGVTCVMFDFDGPLCPLFRGRPTHEIAEVFHHTLREAGLDAAGLAGVKDPYRIFRELRRHVVGVSPLVFELLDEVTAYFEKYLTAEEIDRVSQADLTSGSGDLVGALRDVGVTVAITTNNSPIAVSAFLKRHGMAHLFGDRIFGRTGDPALLKPDPSCVLSALESLRPAGITARQCVLLGDTPADLAAAGSAGVGFIGYCPSQRKAERLLRAGARVWTDDLTTLRRVVARS